MSLIRGSFSHLRTSAFEDFLQICTRDNRPLRFKNKMAQTAFDRFSFPFPWKKKSRIFPILHPIISRHVPPSFHTQLVSTLFLFLSPFSLSLSLLKQRYSKQFLKSQLQFHSLESNETNSFITRRLEAREFIPYEEQVLKQ